MRLSIKKSGADTILYILDSDRINGKVVTKTVLKCGKLSELSKQFDDPIAHFKKVAQEMTLQKTQSRSQTINISFNPNNSIPLGKSMTSNIGYLYLQKVYNGLGISKICNDLKSAYNLDFDLDAILKNFIFTKLLNSDNNSATFKTYNNYLKLSEVSIGEQSKALQFLSTQIELIQTKIYTSSTKCYKKNYSRLYNDKLVVNYDIDPIDNIEDEKEGKQKQLDSKVQIDLLLDGNGIPLYFNINNDNAEIISPLQKKIKLDFEESDKLFYYDSSYLTFDSHHFNINKSNPYIVAYSMKKIRFYLKDWAINSRGWSYKEQSIDLDLSLLPFDSDKLLYKTRDVKEKIHLYGQNIEQEINHKYVIVYSSSYKQEQQTLRQNQVEKAKQIITNPQNYDRYSAANCAKFINKIYYNSAGSIINQSLLSLNNDLILDEIKYEGFQCLITNISDVSYIIDINNRRFKTVEIFRTNLPMIQMDNGYLPRDIRIKSHLLICFLVLLIYRNIEYQIRGKYSIDEVLKTIKNCNLYNLKDEGYIPIYERNDINDYLHELFGFSFTSDIITNKELKILIDSINQY